MSEPRHYTLRIEVEVHNQDDFEHFQPNTVTGSAPELGVEWVSTNDKEALRDFFRFFVREHDFVVVSGDAIAARAFEGEEGELARLKAALDREHEDRTREYEYAGADAELAAKRIRELIAENTPMRDIVQAVADGVVMTAYDSGRDVYVCSGCEREVDGFFTDEELAGASVYEHVQPFIVHKPTCIVLKARQLLGE